MKGYKLYHELKTQYIYSKTFDRSDTLIGIFINCNIIRKYDFDENRKICRDCICEYMCNKMKDYEFKY
ncbi:MAG: hypothetical protein GF317_23560 [Candidatus Lokiarchaeota archaeon]|nr:hypothetical protein [Candidatus Lokiarchaeota archaeon]